MSTFKVIITEANNDKFTLDIPSERFTKVMSGDVYSISRHEAQLRAVKTFCEENNFEPVSLQIIDDGISKQKPVSEKQKAFIKWKRSH